MTSISSPDEDGDLNGQGSVPGSNDAPVDKSDLEINRDSEDKEKKPSKEHFGTVHSNDINRPATNEHFETTKNEGLDEAGNYEENSMTPLSDIELEGYNLTKSLDESMYDTTEMVQLETTSTLDEDEHDTDMYEKTKMEQFETTKNVDEEENTGSVVITASKIEFDYPGQEKTILRLTSAEEKIHPTIEERVQYYFHRFGTYLFRRGRDFQRHTTQYKEKERRWRNNVDTHAWLREKPEGLTIKERTVDMDRKINELTLEIDKIYKMNEGCKRFCLIIGNTTYRGIRELEGCGKDCLYLSALFNKLGFDVRSEENLTAKGITNLLDKVKNELGEVECFVCAITGHGERDTVLGSDEKSVPIKTILDKFDRKNCDKLSDKPKVFLFDVCRGNKEDVAKNHKTPHGSGGPPIKSDLLVVHATSYDYVSFCHPEYGSWFCRSFVKVVSENACKESLLDMLLTVNRTVGTFKSENGSMQSARFDCSMRKHFFFPLKVTGNATNGQDLSQLMQQDTNQ